MDLLGHLIRKSDFVCVMNDLPFFSDEALVSFVRLPSDSGSSSDLDCLFLFEARWGMTARGCDLRGLCSSETWAVEHSVVCWQVDKAFAGDIIDRNYDRFHIYGSS